MRVGAICLREMSLSSHADYKYLSIAGSRAAAEAATETETEADGAEPSEGDSRPNSTG
jgi:hypothetical protein